MTARLHALDSDEARLFLQQGLWLQRVHSTSAAHLKPALEWCLEIASAGHPLPPVGFVADSGHLAFGQDWQTRAKREEHPVPGLPAGLMRTYEDHVLGKIYADWTFARASDALRRYHGRDRARGLAFVLEQFGQRADLPGVELAPGLIKGLLDEPPDGVLQRGWEALSRDGLMPLLQDHYTALIHACRRTAEVLAPEDVFELEHGTALDELSQRLALRQVLQAAQRFEDALPRRRLRPLAGRQEVPTRVLDEDTYPVGGFSSLSNRGSVESLLQSQLAYMEPESRPDLFDVKYLRDELLYYARDENQFLRRRRTFGIVLYPDLVHARCKDAVLPYQRGVLLTGLLLAAVRRLTDWLSTDALRFVFCFLAAEKASPLEHERGLLETLLREQLANGTAEIVSAARPAQVEEQLALAARRSLCHGLLVSTGEPSLAPADTVMMRLRIDGPRPALGPGDEPLVVPTADDPLDCWTAVLRELLQRWI